jgi:hypothetical protein
LSRSADKEEGNAGASDIAQVIPEVGDETMQSPAQSQVQVLAPNQPDETRTSRLIHWLSHRSAMVRFEAHAVAHLQQILCPIVIEEMACRSTDPVVSDISLQAIAGVHSENTPFRGEDLPTGLQEQLRATVTCCFPGSYPWHERSLLNGLAKSCPSLGSPNMLERLGRGMLCLPDFSIFDENKVRAIVASVPFTNALALQAVALLNLPGEDLVDYVITPYAHGTTALDDIVWYINRCVDELPRIEVAELHPWAYHQLRMPFMRMAASAKQNIPDISRLWHGDFILGDLISRLSVDKDPSL